MRVQQSAIIAAILAATMAVCPIVDAKSAEPGQSPAREFDEMPPAAPGLIESSAPVIPPGTTITKSNWTQYKQFFSAGEIGLWEGRWSWRMPDDVQIKVGPTQIYRLPEPFIEMTEKYGDQTRLVRLPDGRWRLKNYIAGMPFPIPREPDMGVKILANMNYRIAPHLIAGFSDSGTVGRICEIDSWGNASCWRVDYDFRQMAYNWEPGVARVEPDAGEAWLGEWVQVEEPEQIRYTADLLLMWQDNLRPPDHYAFIPALRRSLRLSDTTHCEPLFSSSDRSGDHSQTGWNTRMSDAAYDYDPKPGWLEPVVAPPGQPFTWSGGTPTASPQELSIMHGGWNGGIGDFDVSLVRRQKLLALTQLTPEYGKFPDSYDMPLGWAKPSWGRWELRKVWVIEVRPIALIANYCRGKRVMYVDTSLSAPLAEDLYDSNLQLSKVMVLSSQPQIVPGYGTQTWAGGGILQLWDVQGAHAFMSLTADEQGRTWSIDSAVKPQYNRITEFQNPGGLMELMR